MISGFVDIAATDVLPLFRPDGARHDRIFVRRIRKDGEDEWEWISEPADGVAITAHDVLIMRAEIQRFEHEHDLHQTEATRMHSRGRRGTPGPGMPPRHDWDTFFGVLARKIYDNGVPTTQAELVREMLEWFHARNDGQAPDESTVRRKIAVVWRELNRA
jgi:hypothetical protein